MEIINRIKKTFPNLALFTLSVELEKILKNCDSVLDVGCGNNSPLNLLDHKIYMVGVDGYNESINESKKRRIHNKYYLMNVLNINKKFKKRSFDAVVALDIIEHLTKKDGFKLLDMMQKIARKKVVVLTPNGFIAQGGEENGFQEHLSGWNIEDFIKCGYMVSGEYGLKKIRGEKAALLYTPKIFWGLISVLSHLIFTRKNPKYAFSLLCFKNLS